MPHLEAATEAFLLLLAPDAFSLAAEPWLMLRAKPSDALLRLALLLATPERWA